MENTGVLVSKQCTNDEVRNECGQHNIMSRYSGQCESTHGNSIHGNSAHIDSTQQCGIIQGKSAQCDNTNEHWEEFGDYQNYHVDYSQNSSRHTDYISVNYKQSVKDSGIKINAKSYPTEIQDQKSNQNKLCTDKDDCSGSVCQEEEDDLLFGESQQPCECDECIFGAEKDKPIPVRFSQKQSSWKKIRNVVHWAPFIQQFKKRKYPWIQLAGHQGNFQAGNSGAILKKYDDIEDRAFKKLMMDVLQPFVPNLCGEQIKDGVRYLQLQDLLCEFEAPFVMDVKMGFRTYLEDELIAAREKPSLRKDMYQKMVEVDPTAPTAEENQQKAITKARYMQWRDDASSTTEMGFRIEGIRKSDGGQVKNFKTTKERKNITKCLKQFVEENPVIIKKYLHRLKAIRESQEISPFFKGHELIGSSLLFVHDRNGEGSVWMIDFGKTVSLPESASITHRLPWKEGNKEDGYLFGVDRLITIFEEMDVENSVDCLSESESLSSLPDKILS